MSKRLTPPSGPHPTTNTNCVTSTGNRSITGPVETSPPMLIGRMDSAHLCGVSPASWDRLTSAGKTPASLRLGGRVLWRRSDLELWISHGCPDRKTFAVLTGK